MMKPSLALLCLLAPALASAQPAPVPPPAAPAFEVIDRGDAVEVIARNVKAARTGITPIRSRLEVPLVGTPRAEPGRPIDKTVKSIELDGAPEARVLSVKLDFERTDVKTLARYAQALQVGDDLHLIVPRKVPDGTKPVVLPEPTLSPAMLAKLAADKPIEVTREPLPVLGPQQPAVKPVDVAAAKPDAKPEVAASTAKPKDEAKPIAKADDPSTFSKLTIYGVAGLLLAGCGLWIVRRRKAQQQPMSSIEVIAQRTLGPKAKVVWLSAGNREMLVSVTAQQVRMLGTWRKSEAPVSLPAAIAMAESRNSDRDHPPLAFAGRDERTTTPPTSNNSPAVAGIMRLRAKTVPPPAPLDDDIATGDSEADAVWAKEILLATTRSRRAMGTGSGGR